MNRLDTITERLISPFGELGHQVLVANDKQEWQTCLSHFSDRFLGNELRYGFTVPFALDGAAPGLAFAIFPQLILDQTKDESDNTFIQYLQAVEYRLNYQFAWFGDNEKVNRIEVMLYDEAPGAIDVLNSIQVRVLDEEANANG